MDNFKLFSVLVFGVGLALLNTLRGKRRTDYVPDHLHCGFDEHGH